MTAVEWATVFIWILGMFAVLAWASDGMSRPW